MNIKSLSETGDSKTGPLVPLLILKNSVPESLYLKSAPSASRIISPPISSVKSPASEIVEPSIVISSTVKVVRLAN